MKLRVSTTVFVLVISFGLCQHLYGWGGSTTHPALTEKAIRANSKLDEYLRAYLGLESGIETKLEWHSGFDAYLRYRMTRREDPTNTTRSVIDWIKTGSMLEDEDGYSVPQRARHHFHAPISNTGLAGTGDANPNAGLDNRTDHPYFCGSFQWVTGLIWPTDFDVTGESAEHWAIEGTAEQQPTFNWHCWKRTRDTFFMALIYDDKNVRERLLANTFLSLGHILHMIEDVGVPAHVRNDFLFGHFRTVLNKGNPLENYADRKVAKNKEQKKANLLEGLVPPGWTPQPKTLNKVSSFFDSDVYTGDYPDGQTPSEDLWGLAERSNYQFLSYSTVFGCGGIKYQFPHPAEEHMDAPLVENNKVYFQGLSRYGVEHLARNSYTWYLLDPETGDRDKEVDETNTTRDQKVFEDYAEIIIPRIINYAAGLANYFFRGRLEVEVECSAGDILLTIRNMSRLLCVEQVLRGGTFWLYWDDVAGNRTEVSSFVVYEPGSESVPWDNQTSTLGFQQTTKAKLLASQVADAKKCVLVYAGNINDSSAPLDDDPHDSSAVAVCSFQPKCEAPPRSGSSLIAIGSVRTFDEDGTELGFLPLWIDRTCHLDASGSVFVVGSPLCCWDSLDPGTRHSIVQLNAAAVPIAWRIIGTDNRLVLFAVDVDHGDIYVGGGCDSGCLGYDEPYNAFKLVGGIGGTLIGFQASSTGVVRAIKADGLGNVYVGTDNTVRKYDSSLTLQWTANVDPDSRGWKVEVLRVASNGDVVVGTAGDDVQYPGNIQWLRKADGSPKWTYPVRGEKKRGIGLDSQDCIYLNSWGYYGAGCDWGVIKLNSNGGHEWHQCLDPGIVVDSLTVKPDDTVLVTVWSVGTQELDPSDGSFIDPPLSSYGFGTLATYEYRVSRTYPTDGATSVSIHTVLQWPDQIDAESYDVYFNGAYQGNQSHTRFDPGTLSYNTPYTWRIDAVGPCGVTAGSTRTFTTEL